MTSNIYSGYRCANLTTPPSRCVRCNALPGGEFCMDCGYPREDTRKHHSPERATVEAFQSARKAAIDQAYRDGYYTGHMHGRGMASNEHLLLVDAVRAVAATRRLFTGLQLSHMADVIMARSQLERDLDHLVALLPKADQ